MKIALCDLCGAKVDGNNVRNMVEFIHAERLNGMDGDARKTWPTTLRVAVEIKDTSQGFGEVDVCKACAAEKLKHVLSKLTQPNDPPAAPSS